MELSAKILSDITIYSKYARYIEEKNRRENWEEICLRNCEMHCEKYPHLRDDITQIYEKFVLTKKVLPSMRSLQFSGKPILVNPTRQFNCSYLSISDPVAFSEVMFLLLGGTGVGYSVQKHHVEKLPIIQGVITPTGRKRKKRYLVADSIEGWADAIKVLVNSYFDGGVDIDFDLRDIRQKGTRLVTAGGKAPGPAPLRICLAQIKNIFENAIQERGRGTKLNPIECHDICCYIADSVLSGGIRRSACISLFSVDDDDMLYCKSGNWWENNPQRARANNSVVLLKNRLTKDKFFKIWEIIKNSGSGEPGFFITNDINTGLNPCAEVSLKDCEFCNLTEINVSDVIDQVDYNERSEAAAIIGTIQASYTDFHYLRDQWKINCEENALLGVSRTGIASNAIKDLDSTEAAKCAVNANIEWAKKLGINPAKRVTTGKPSGTTSCVLGCSSGIHAWHAPFFIRRMRLNKDEQLYKYIKGKMPDLVEDEIFNPSHTAVLSVPIKSPKDSIVRNDESALDLMNRFKESYINWILPGHIDGSNTHNQSVTISIKDDEWANCGDWMWENVGCYTGISVLPYDGGTYKQAPFEDCSEECYAALMSSLSMVDLDEISEFDDNTDLTGEVSCFNGECLIV